MWKWTDPKDIQLLILDGDSLEEEYLIYPYSIGEEKIKTIIVTKIDSSLEYDNSMMYFDVYDLLQEIIKNEHCESYSYCFYKQRHLIFKINDGISHWDNISWKP